MKKYLFLVVLGIFTFMPISAQNTIFNNPNNKAHFGVRIGGEVTCPGNLTSGNVGIGMFKNGTGVELGGIYNLPIAANFYFEPGLKLYYNGYSTKKFILDLLNDLDIYEVNINSLSFQKFGMRVPLMIGYHFDFTNDVKISVFTGPEIEIGFLANETIKSGAIKFTDSLYEEDGGMSRMNILWGIGAGINIKHFYIGISGGIGMINMIPDLDAKFHENRVTLSLGYNF